MIFKPGPDVLPKFFFTHSCSPRHPRPYNMFYLYIEGHKLVSAWVSVNPVPSIISMEAVRGSHLSNTTYRTHSGRARRYMLFHGNILHGAVDDVDIDHPGRSYASRWPFPIHATCIAVVRSSRTRKRFTTLNRKRGNPSVISAMQFQSSGTTPKQTTSHIQHHCSRQSIDGCQPG